MAVNALAAQAKDPIHGAAERIIHKSRAYFGLTESVLPSTTQGQSELPGSSQMQPLLRAAHQTGLPGASGFGRARRPQGARV